LRITRDVASLDDFHYEDFEVVDYQTHPHIKAQVAV
jgi:thymidylate synthase